MRIIHKLKNHENAIDYLCWFPSDSIKDTGVSEGLVDEELKVIFGVADLSMVLCSSSDDKTIRLWRADKGEEIMCIKAPGAVGGSTSRGNRDKQTTNIAFTPLCWPSARCLVSGSFKYSYNSFLWNLFKNK